MRKRAYDYVYNTNKGRFTSISLSNFKRQIIKDPSVKVLIYCTLKDLKGRQNDNENNEWLITTESLVDKAKYILSGKKHVNEPKKFECFSEATKYINQNGMKDLRLRICSFGGDTLYFEDPEP